MFDLEKFADSLKFTVPPPNYLSFSFDELSTLFFVLEKVSDPSDDHGFLCNDPYIQSILQKFHSYSWH